MQGDQNGLPIQYQPQMQDISRQLKLADALRSQSQQPLTGQMVSGHYVKPAITQYLAQALNGYNAGATERDAEKKQTDLLTGYQTKQNNASQALIDGLKGSDVQTGTTNSMPAYTPDQQDQFGSPLPNVQRPVTSTPIMTHQAATPDQIQAAQLKYAQDTGNYGQIGQVANQMATHAINQADKVDDRTYQSQNEEKLYNRNRTDKLTDTEAQQKYDDIVRKDTQGFQTSQQDRQFVQAFKLQNSSQGFQAGQQSRSQAFQASQERQKQTFELQKAGAEDANNILSPDALNVAAEVYRTRGTLPPLGMGKVATKSRNMILNSAAFKDNMENVTAREAAVNQITGKNTASALQQVSKQEAMVGAFEKNAQLNGNLALSLSDKVDRTGVPVFNKWMQAGQKSIAGDADVSAFNAANETFTNEYAKIMSGSMGNTVVSDSAREHARDMLSTTQTKEQYKSVMNVLNQDMANRMTGFSQQKEQLNNSHILIKYIHD